MTAAADPRWARPVIHILDEEGPPVWRVRCDSMPFGPPKTWPVPHGFVYCDRLAKEHGRPTPLEGAANCPGCLK